ncbi:MAG: DUF2585 family protein, partial [Deltaproteobacteria bacterium]|nr:DUF2585 family protein [Deltaproteobacteria bacterium]
MKSKLSTISCILLLCLILAAHTLILLMMGRIPWCTCGHFQIWMGEAWSSHTSQHLLDPYSFSHVQHGILFFFVLYLCRVRPALGFWIACFTEVAWEILENSSIIIERYRSATA